MEKDDVKAGRRFWGGPGGTERIVVKVNRKRVSVWYKLPKSSVFYQIPLESFVDWLNMWEALGHDPRVRPPQLDRRRLSAGEREDD